MAMSNPGEIKYNYGNMHDGADQMMGASLKLNSQIDELGSLIDRLLAEFRTQLTSDQLAQVHTQFQQVSSLHAQTVGCRGRETANAADGMQATDKGCAALFDTPVRV